MKKSKPSSLLQWLRRPSLRSIFSLILFYTILFIFHSISLRGNSDEQDRRFQIKDIQAASQSITPAKPNQTTPQTTKSSERKASQAERKAFATNLTEENLQPLAKGIRVNSLPAPVKNKIIPALTLVVNGSQRGEIWIYKAFDYDESYVHFEGNKYVIVLAMAAIRKKVSMYLSPTCVLWTSEEDFNPLVAPASAIQTSAHANVIYENRFIKHVGFRCRIPHEHANVSYSFVSVFYKAEWLNVTSDETLHNWLLGYARITKIESVKPEDKRDFGYCGSTWYYLENQTSTDPYRLLEWLDYHTMIGIERFHIALPPASLHQLQLPQKTMSVLQYFKARGMIEFSEAPVMTKHPGSVWGLVQPLQPLVINDCFLTNRKKYNFIVITDSDEAIILRSNFSNYSRGKSLLRNLIDISTWHPSTQRAHSYRMSQYMFLTNCQNLPDVNTTELRKYKVDQESNYYITKYFTGQLYYTWGKSILSTHQCQTVSAHGCLTAASLNQGLIQRTVPKYMARVHHYREALRHRDGGFSYKKARTECYGMVRNSTAIEDNLILPYLDQIKGRLTELEHAVLGT